MSKVCPNCRLINVDTADRCDCSYSFTSEVIPQLNKGTGDDSDSSASKKAWGLTLLSAILLFAPPIIAGTKLNFDDKSTLLVASPIVGLVISIPLFLQAFVMNQARLVLTIGGIVFFALLFYIYLFLNDLQHITFFL